MKAILSRESGGPETLVLGDAPDPIAGPGEVLIRVAAAGVNFPDSLIIADRYQVRPQRPFSPGAEVSGTIEGVGEGVAGFHPGDRVLAVLTFGGLAEKAVARAANCSRIPDAMPFDEAAAFMLTYATSYHGLHERAGLQAGETLLVLGAAGGVGLAAVELGRAAGARVLAAVSTPEKLEVAKRHGAVDGIVYGTQPLDRDAQKALSAALKTLCGEKGADVIYDPVGGDFAEPALRAIGWGGRYLVIGFPAGIPKLPLNLTLLKGCGVLGVYWGGETAQDPTAHERVADRLFALYEAGRVRPAISAHYPLAQAGAAIEALTSRRSTGKVVVTVS